MKSKQKLPPLWIKIFSWIFLMFALIPVSYLLNRPFASSGGRVSAFGLRIVNTGDAEVWFLSLIGILFLGSLTGLFILTKRSFAYDFGLFYCLTAVVVTITAHAVGFSPNPFIPKYHVLDIAVQYLLLSAFLYHLAINRSNWRATSASKSLQATGTSPVA
ncbi:LPXTG cell wall anchor domain-containing protein [Pelagicoccus sp. SDUM812005]|nr:LPXTG cell wall anchor domain-containing protein [Pelagicoccus sp. SDUM812005]